MKTGILITARLGSARLKKKHLLKVCTREILHYLLQRIYYEFKTEIESGSVEVVIATSTEPENREFKEIFGEICSVFQGSNDNIPLRHLQCAEALALEHIISIDGDDILCSPEGMRVVYQELLKGREFVKTSNLPFGMNSSGYSVEFLRTSLVDLKNDILETGWTRIFDSDSMLTIPLGEGGNNSNLRFTLDYEEDYRFFTQVIEGCIYSINSCTTTDIVKYVLEKQLYRLTDCLNEQYWTYFHSNKNKEETRNEMKQP